MELKGQDKVALNSLPSYRQCVYCGIAIYNKKIRTTTNLTPTINKYCCVQCKNQRGDKTLREYLWWLLEQLNKKTTTRGSEKWLNKIGRVSKELAKLEN